MSAFIDLTGKTYNCWTVLSFDNEHSTRDHKRWICKCKCGIVRSVDRANLVNGISKSCGCYSRERARNRRNAHHESKTRLYKVWVNMRKRCRNPHDKSYLRYGGRGIKVCDEWNDYLVFKAWAMSTGYDESAAYGECTLDRINVNGGYSPDNCRWISTAQQSYNRRSNHRITYNGETLTIREWEEKLHLRKGIVSSRLHRGWNEIRALTTPIKTKESYEDE